MTDTGSTSYGDEGFRDRARGMTPGTTTRPAVTSEGQRPPAAPPVTAGPPLKWDEDE